jgi:hypothetical protein
MFKSERILTLAAVPDDVLELLQAVRSGAAPPAIPHPPIGASPGLRRARFKCSRAPILPSIRTKVPIVAFGQSQVLTESFASTSQQTNASAGFADSLRAFRKWETPPGDTAPIIYPRTSKFMVRAQPL